MKQLVPVIPVRLLDVSYLSVSVHYYNGQELLARPLFCSSTHASSLCPHHCYPRH